MSDVDQLRVLIVRLGAMGDILHALPAITALRVAHPGWLLGWAVEPQWQALLATEAGEPRTPAMPLVDRVHTIAAKHWARHPFAAGTLTAILRARHDLRAAEYDLAIDLQGAIRSAMVARWARPRRLIGEAEPRESAARFLFTDRIATSGVHVIEQAAEVTRALAPGAFEIPTLPLPLLPVDPLAEAWCTAHAPRTAFVLLSPGAGWGAKRWPTERYAEVARSLAQDGLPVVVNASPAEQALAEGLVARASFATTAEAAPGRKPGAMTVLTPSLAQLIALTRRATLVIAGDTGPLHLAAALGLPTVAIFGPTDPARNGPFHGQSAGRHIILRHPESRRDHSRRAEPEAGLLTITPNEVLAAARALLATDVAQAPGTDKAHA